MPMPLTNVLWDSEYKLRKKCFKKLVLTLLLAVCILPFSIPVFAQARFQGIDVSKYQGQIDWNRVKNSGVQFAMIRTGYGGDPSSWNRQTDAYFESNYSGATGAGLKVGAYHYSYATNASMASDEADFCLHILNGRHLDYPVAYDLEDRSQAGVSPDVMAQIVQTFCGKLQLAGYKPAVYSYVNFYNARLTSPLVAQFDTWIANYVQAPAPNFGRSYTMWQYSSGGSVAGISGRCDMDYSYVDYSAPTVPSTPMDPMTFRCDTDSYEFDSVGHYTYKITTADTLPPSAVSSNPAAVTVSGPTGIKDGYLFTITDVGPGDAAITTTAADGRTVTLQATGF